MGSREGPAVHTGTAPSGGGYTEAERRDTDATAMLQKIPRTLLALAAVNGFLAVALGAFGAHGLKSAPGMDEYRLGVWKTGTDYHLAHALALLFVALLADRLPAASQGRARLVGWLFAAGIVIFSGSLYALTLTGVRALGAITPLGGVSFLLGWALLAALALRPSPAPSEEGDR